MLTVILLSYALAGMEEPTVTAPPTTTPTTTEPTATKPTETEPDTTPPRPDPIDEIPLPREQPVAAPDAPLLEEVLSREDLPPADVAVLEANGLVGAGDPISTASVVVEQDRIRTLLPDAEAPLEVRSYEEIGARVVVRRLPPSAKRESDGRRLRRSLSSAPGKATVMIASVVGEPRHGSLLPVVRGTSRVWRVRAISAAKLFSVCHNDPAVAGYAEPSIGFCSGVLVGPGLVLTAKHCVREVARPSQMRVILDHTRPRASEFAADKVLRVEIEELGSGIEDWALLRVLDPIDPNRRASTCRSGDVCNSSEEVNAIHHPLGMSRKGDDGRVLHREPTRLSTSLNTYVGSSGAPVFDNATQRVVGIVVSGRADFRRSGRACAWTSSAHRDRSLLRHERVLPLDALPASVRNRFVDPVVEPADEAKAKTEKGTPAAPTRK